MFVESRARLCLVVSALASLAIGGCAEDRQDGRTGGGGDAQVPASDAALDGHFSNGGDAASVGSSSDGSTQDAASKDGSSTVGGDAGDRTERCDGLDNDGDGQTDNVDVGKDGVCDCLTIATLGEAGKHGLGDVFGNWLNTRSDLGATQLGKQTLTPALLSKYQVLIAQDLRTLGRQLSADELLALENWVKAGGGLMTLIGYGDSSERTNANLALGRFGMSYAATPILQKQGGQTVPIEMWNAHPVSMGVSRVGVDNGYAVAGAGTVVATAGGFDVMRAQEVGQGHVVAWGDEWITYNSEWSALTNYQVERLWLNTLKWLTVARVCQVPVPVIF